MMPQSLGRIGKLPIESLIAGLPNEVFFGIGGMLLLIGILWTHDLFHKGKIHPVSFVGGPALIGMIVLGATVLSKTEYILDLIVWLNKIA